MIYLYAFSENSWGMMKKDLCVSSASVAKEPATTYKKGSTVAMAKAPTIT